MAMCYKISLLWRDTGMGGTECVFNLLIAFNCYAVCWQNKDKPLSKLLQRGEDPVFDQVCLLYCLFFFWLVRFQMCCWCDISMTRCLLCDVIKILLMIGCYVLQLLSALNSVSEHSLPSMLHALFEWYGRQNPMDEAGNCLYRRTNRSRG